MNRRIFFKNMMVGMGALLLQGRSHAIPKRPKSLQKDIRATVYRAINGQPKENMAKVFELMGGVRDLIGKNDVVVIKPNIQWWNHGVPNLQAVKSIIDLIFDRPGGFEGEVILIENIHRGSKPWNHAGWTKPFTNNSNLNGVKNYGEMGALLKSRYGKRFSITHLINVKDGGHRIFSPSEGSGYVYCDGTGGPPLISFNNGAKGENYREVIMTYPVFQSDLGTVVDFRFGIWEKGRYTGRPWKYINVAGINHHSTWCGVSSTVKNWLGISDLSGVGLEKQFI